MYALGDVTTETSGRPPLHTLHVNAHSGFNKSSVQCVAIFNNGNPSETSPPVEIIIQGLYYIRNEYHR